MKKQNLILSTALTAIFSSSVVLAEAEVTGKIVHESAAFTESGIGIGAATTSTQTANSHGKDVFKTATHAKIFIDGDAEELAEGATYHVELNAFNDGKGIGDYDGNESYTQRDALREAYVDAEVNDYSFRVGKQQVVWGTADGMKLLDAINPTDYSEMAQNQMEDSRIPVWMVNAETEDNKGGSWQFIASEGKSNHIAGMGKSSGKNTAHTNGSQGHAFIMKGVDTITGKVNGFLNLAPAMGTVATAFDGMAYSSGSYVTLSPFTVQTVDDFVSTSVQDTGFEGICTGGVSDASCLAAVAHDPTTPVGGYTAANNNQVQNLIDAYDDDSKWSTSNPNSMFEYLGSTTFKTFDSFVGMTSEYRVNHSSSPSISTRYKNSTSDGLNYSFNIIHGNDSNPYVDMHWENDLGTKLYEIKTTQGTDYSLILGDSTSDTATEVGGTSKSGSPGATRKANLVMTEKLNQITQIGGSFDTAIETSEFGPVVLRGEALYQKDVMSPVVTRKATNGVDLNHGFLVSSVKMEKGDRFKYVLGADITALTNMMVSMQFIQDRNLDFVDVGNSSADDWKYTADMATMHVTNNLNKGEENKEFYSLFLSKPFGASGEHRWNNIFMFEENGGKWNRLDAEFSIDDDTQVTAEWNKYWGDANTQFGQLEKSSNIQVGFKYSF